MEEHDLIGLSPFTEQESSSSSIAEDMYRDLEGEAESRLEKYSIRVLTHLGNQLGVQCLILLVRDNNQNRGILRIRLRLKQGKWNVETDIREDYHPRPCRAGHAIRPTFVLKSQFCYYLDLPHRWFGTLNIEFRGITFISPERDSAIRQELRIFSKDITILLMDRSLARLQNALNEEKKVTEVLRALTANLSKELYCLSSIANVIGQSYNVEGVLTRVLEAILPLLRANLGAIYFPDTGQCVSLQSPKSNPRRIEDPWLRYYFESKIRLYGESSKLDSFTIQSVTDHPRFPIVLKAHLASQGIESVLEFSLRHHQDLIGLGFLGLRQTKNQPADTRLLMTALNMIGLFLEHISLMGDLERQLKLISKEKTDVEKTQRFIIDHVGRSYSSHTSKRSSSKDRLLEEIEQSRNMALLAELASGIAHQIRNPLNNLVYALHLLQQENVPEGEKKDLIHNITERVELINRMINEFIQYTRTQDVKLCHESINDILNNTLRSFKAWMDLARVELVTSFDPDLPITRVDMFLLNQAFHNIIKNAMEAMNNDGHLWVFTRKLKIRHGPEPRLEFAQIVIEDDGPGLAAEEINMVMKPFYSRKEGGLGLGLALVDHIVRVHGGAITLESRPNGGTKAMICLPIR
jgi:signal transduction histidine kinase